MLVNDDLFKLVILGVVSIMGLCVVNRAKTFEGSISFNGFVANTKFTA